MSSLRDIAVRHPRTGQIDATIQADDEARIGEKAQRVRRHQAGWYAEGVEHRVSALRQWRDALENHRDAIERALIADTGRRRLARGEVDGLLGSIERWCELAPGLLAERNAPAKAIPNVDILETSDPFPLLGVISPWNFPLLLSFIDATPALLAGCGVLIKPSEVTPRFAEPVMASLADVPGLKDVIAFCPGDGQTGAALIPAVDVVAFTGSVSTGKKVLETAAKAFVPAYLELGGKDPVIVLEGSDVPRAAQAIARASLVATGQACQSIERVYAHDSLADALIDNLVRETEKATLTYPDERSGVVGPLIFQKQAGIIRAHLEDAVAKGAIVHVGGNVLHQGGGYWAEPTVLGHVDHSMRIMTEETFGPIIPVMSFATQDEAIELANQTIYGLSAGVFGPTAEAASHVARRIDAGGVSVNDAGMTTMLFETEKSAFGFSGLGPSRVGPSGLTRFLRRKSIYINHGPVVPIDVFGEN